MEESAKHQEVGDKIVSRHGVSVFLHLFLLFIYSHQCGPLPLYFQTHRAVHKEGTGVRMKRGRLGKAFMCCVVTVCRACPAAFLSLCISLSPKSVPKPVTLCIPHGPSCLPLGTALGIALRLPWAGGVLLMEPGLKEEQEAKKCGGKGVVLTFGNLGISSWGLWYSQCPSDIHTHDWQLREKARLSPIPCKKLKKRGERAVSSRNGVTALGCD